MPKPPKTNPVPSELPKSLGFNAASSELYDGVYMLRENLETAHTQMLRERNDDTTGRVPLASWDVKAYSTSITVLAAATAEATLNMYGVLRFGTEQFESHFAGNGPITKFKRLIKHARKITIDDSDPLVMALQSLCGRRNAYLHPRIYESIRDETGKFSENDEVWKRIPTYETALQSIDEMEHFLKGFRELDPRTSTLLIAWRIPRRRTT